MTSLTHFRPWIVAPVSEAKTATGPDLKKRPGPIFIHDAVIPWQQETLLLSILRRQAADVADDD